MKNVKKLWTAEEIKKAFEAGKDYRFYHSAEWRRLKEAILRESHNECKWCKAMGIISPAETVHHVQWVEKHPELALARKYIYKGVEYDNLIPLCHTCHDKAHNRMQFKKRPKKKYITEERW